MKTICLSLLVLTGSLLGARGEDYRTDINPALLYYQAFLLAPDPMSEADRDYCRSKEAKEKNLPERFGPIAAGYDNQFRLVRKAAHATVPCDWGVDLSAGPNAMLPHLARARAVVQAASFRAVWDLQHGNQADARDDLLAAFVLARNVPQNGTLICTLAQNANEAVIYVTVAAIFGEFSPETLKQLADGFDRASARHTVAACLPATKSIREWFVGRILELQKAYPNDDARVMAGFRELAWMDDTNLWPQIVAASGGTSKGVLKLFDELESRYPRLAELMALPEREFETQAKQFFADGRKSRNPFVVESVIAWEKARPVEFTIQALQAMVRAAVEYKLHGEAGLKGVMDPFGNGPFAFQRFEFKGVDRGFELKSAYAGAGAPFVLIFVEKQGPAFQITGPNAGKEIAAQ